jgi:hypothetical protein
VGQPILNLMRAKFHYGLFALVEWTCWGSNPGPPPCKGGDLPADLQAPVRMPVQSILFHYYLWLAVFRVFLARVAGVLFCFVRERGFVLRLGPAPS